MAKTRGKGRPENAKASDILSIEEKVLWEQAKFMADNANNLATYYGMLKDIAMGSGDFKDASVTNRKSALEKIIAITEDYIKKEDEVSSSETPVEQEDSSQNKTAPLIDLRAVK